MALSTLFDTEDGVARLLAQPEDVAPRKGAHRAQAEATAPAEYQSLFADYRHDLRLAYDLAEAWWAGTVEAQEDEGLSREEALAEAFDTRLAGPASNPSVVYMVRTYWLLCEAENLRRSDGIVVYPEELLLQWLVDAGEEELVRLIACMPYWPLGLDADGNWC